MSRLGTTLTVAAMILGVIALAYGCTISVPRLFPGFW
jgi:hypothetical protein